MPLETFTRFLIATALVTLIPGPNILLIVNNSIRHGIKNGLITVLGVSAGMVPLFLLSLGGISTLLIKWVWLFDGVRLAGMLYLLYLGGSMVISFFKPQNAPLLKSSPQNRFFVTGMAICMTNPKGLLFAGAFFPQFIEKSAPVIPQAVLLVTGCLIVATLVGGLYALFAGTARALFQSDRFSRYTALISGCTLILFGLSFLFAGEKDFN